MKSIKAKLIVFLGLLIGGICIGLSAISFINSTRSLQSNLSKTLPIIAEQTASSVQGRVEGQLSELEGIAAIPEIKDVNSSWENKSEILLEQAKRMGSMKLGIVDKNGDTKSTDGSTASVKDREYCQKALSGKSNVSDPLIGKLNGDVQVKYAVPIKNNNEVVGVLIETRDGNQLSELTNQVKVGTTGNAFMIKKRWDKHC